MYGHDVYMHAARGTKPMYVRMVLKLLGVRDRDMAGSKQLCFGKTRLGERLTENRKCECDPCLAEYRRNHSFFDSQKFKSHYP